MAMIKCDKTKKLEKVTGALQTCLFATEPCFNKNCPYYEFEKNGNCVFALHKDAFALIKSLSKFKVYFDDLYGQGLEIANWHLNGELEPFDNFYDSAMEGTE